MRFRKRPLLPGRRPCCSIGCIIEGVEPCGGPVVADAKSLVAGVVGILGTQHVAAREDHLVVGVLEQELADMGEVAILFTPGQAWRTAVDETHVVQGLELADSQIVSRNRR